MVSLPPQVAGGSHVVCHNALHLPIFSGYNIRIMISCYTVNPYQDNAARSRRAASISPRPGHGAALAVTVYSITAETLDMSWKGLTSVERCLPEHPRVRMLAHIAFAGGEDASSMRFRSSRRTGSRYTGSPSQRGTNGGYRTAPWDCQ